MIYFSSCNYIFVTRITVSMPSLVKSNLFIYFPLGPALIKEGDELPNKPNPIPIIYRLPPEKKIIKLEILRYVLTPEAL